MEYEDDEVPVASACCFLHLISAARISCSSIVLPDLYGLSFSAAHLHAHVLQAQKHKPMQVCMNKYRLTGPKLSRLQLGPAPTTFAPPGAALAHTQKGKRSASWSLMRSRHASCSNTAPVYAHDAPIKKALRPPLLQCVLCIQRYCAGAAHRPASGYSSIARGSTSDCLEAAAPVHHFLSMLYHITCQYVLGLKPCWALTKSSQVLATLVTVK